MIDLTEVERRYDFMLIGEKSATRCKNFARGMWRCAFRLHSGVLRPLLGQGGRALRKWSVDLQLLLRQREPVLQFHLRQQQAAGLKRKQPGEVPTPEVPDARPAPTRPLPEAGLFGTQRRCQRKLSAERR